MASSGFGTDGTKNTLGGHGGFGRPAAAASASTRRTVAAAFPVTRRKVAALCGLAGALVLAGCSNSAIVGTGTSVSGITRTYQRGYVLSEGALDQVPVGSSQEQVLLVLGTPSTVATLNGDVFYYISQTQQKVAFLKPEITEQRVLAVYFGKDRRVTKIAQYGLKDGKIFDFVSQTTPTSGDELSLLRQVIGFFDFKN